MTTHLETSLTARWHPDGQGATLLKEDGSIAGTLEIVTWYPPMQRRPVAAWVVSWVDTSGEEPVMHRAPVEIPAHGAAGPARRATLLQAAADARQRGPAPIAARAPALPNRPDARQRVRQAELLIDAWDRAFGQLTAAAADDGSSGTYLRYLALTELLARTYTVDRTLQGMWDDVPADLQELASQHADDEALAAIAHNTRVVASSGRLYDPGRERGFDAFFERQRNGAPYPHWTGPLLTGVLQEPFFRGLRWIRGHMTYRGVTDPIELWQYTDGAEPRWKWKDSAAVTSERGNPRERKLYDELLAGQDVLGYFSHLIEVFTEARWFLRALLLRAENRRPYT